MDSTEESGDKRENSEWGQRLNDESRDVPIPSPEPSIVLSDPIDHSRHSEQRSIRTFCRYFDELIGDMRTLDALQMYHPERLRYTCALLTAEIDRVWSIIYGRTLQDQLLSSNNRTPQQQENQATPSDESVIIIQEKIMIPQRPDCKFIGRILGPRGISVKQLEAQTNCRILIRGKGSVKDPEREARLRNRMGWEHLAEPLHVLISACDVSHERCSRKLANGVHAIRLLLSTNNDEHKRRQLVQLAIINGTYRPTKLQ